MTTDLFIGCIFEIVCVETSRCQSSMLGALAILAFHYMLLSNFLPGIFDYADLQSTPLDRVIPKLEVALVTLVVIPWSMGLGSNIVTGWVLTVDDS